MNKKELKKVNILSAEIEAMDTLSQKFFRDPYLIKLKISQQGDRHGNGRDEFHVNETSPEVKRIIRAFYSDIKKVILFDLETKRIQFEAI